MTNLQIKSLLKNLKIVGSAFLTEDQIDLLETLCNFYLEWGVEVCMELSTELLSKELPLLNDTVENIATSINEKYEEVKGRYDHDIIWIEESEDGTACLIIHPTELKKWLNIASKTFTKEAEQAQAEFMAEETERFTRFSRELSSWSDWRSSDYVQGWMTDFVELGFIKIIYNDDKSCFKLEITQAGIDALKQETQAEEVPALTADQLETLTSISKNHHYCCTWRNPANIVTWMDDLANLGLIKFICDIVGGNFRFKLEITQAGIDILKQETITDSSDIDFKSEFSCNDPAFNFNEYLVQTAENYDRPLTKKALENIFAEITKHHQSEFGDYDRIEYALCTESNEYPAGINVDNRYGEFYVLDFADTDVVLHLVK